MSLSKTAVVVVMGIIGVTGVIKPASVAAAPASGSGGGSSGADADTAAASAPTCDEVTDTEKKACDDVESKYATGDAVLVCVRATTGCFYRGPQSIVPNTRIVVAVHTDGDAATGKCDQVSDVAVGLDGKASETIAGTYGEAASAPHDFALNTAPIQDLPAKTFVSIFAPRAPGPVTITMVVTLTPPQLTRKCVRTATLNALDDADSNADRNLVTANSALTQANQSTDQARAAAGAAQAAQAAGASNAAAVDRAQRDLAHAKDLEQQRVSDYRDARDYYDKVTKATAAQRKKLDDSVLPGIGIKTDAAGSDPGKGGSGELPRGFVDCWLSQCVSNVITTSTPQPADDKKPSAKETKTYKYELLVSRIYSGALRLGLGGIRVPGLGHNLGTRTAAGTDIPRIVDNGADPVDVELVVGYAPFWLDLLECPGGRIYAKGNACNTHIAPYIGIGAISSAPNSKVDYLRSIYAGIELELSPSTSLALALVIRRVDVLASGLSVGMPVASGTALTTSEYDRGVGLVVNFTPSFFQFAASSLPKL